MLQPPDEPIFKLSVLCVICHAQPLSDTLFVSMTGQATGPCWSRHSLIGCVIAYHKPPVPIGVHCIRQTVWPPRLEIHTRYLCSSTSAYMLVLFFPLLERGLWFLKTSDAPYLCQFLILPRVGTFGTHDPGAKTNVFFELPPLEFGFSDVFVLFAMKGLFCPLWRAEASGG